jgi:outer membrane protein TolC
LALEEQLSVIRGQALPATARSLQAVTAAFSSGSASLLEWVDVARSELALQLESVALQAELARALAGLQRAVGTSLPRSSLSQESKQ